MNATRYRWRMRPVGRALRVTGLALCGVILASAALEAHVEVWWRALCLVGVVSAVLGIRTLVGAVLIVREDGLRLQKVWPKRRDIPWYRILATDVVPGFWNLEIELNSGERVELPPVADVEALYEDIERHRTALDA